MVQWLRVCASIAGGAGFIPGQGTKIPHAKKKKKKEWENPHPPKKIVKSTQQEGSQAWLKPGQVN